jgi:hypothetical protein
MSSHGVRTPAKVECFKHSSLSAHQDDAGQREIGAASDPVEIGCDKTKDFRETSHESRAVAAMQVSALRHAIRRSLGQQATTAACHSRSNRGRI